MHQRAKDSWRVQIPGVALCTLLFVFLLVPIVGCARGARFRPAQLEPDQSVIYVSRPQSVFTPGRVRVYVDQNLVAWLGPNRFVTTIVSPGEHFVRVERKSVATRRVVLGTGESVFLECGVSLFGGQVSLIRPDQTVARERIASARAFQRDETVLESVLPEAGR